jgi:hypothetical protein
MAVGGRGGTIGTLASGTGAGLGVGTLGTLAAGLGGRRRGGGGRLAGRIPGGGRSGAVSGGAATDWKMSARRRRAARWSSLTGARGLAAAGCMSA